MPTGEVNFDRLCRLAVAIHRHGHWPEARDRVAAAVKKFKATPPATVGEDVLSVASDIGELLSIPTHVLRCVMRQLVAGTKAKVVEMELLTMLQELESGESTTEAEERVGTKGT